MKGQNQRFHSRLVCWFQKAGRDLPWRWTRDPYAILVSEMMLQQTQVSKVIAYYNRWMQRFPDVAALARADEQEVLCLWEGLGYYSRARNLHRAARIIVEKNGGAFPQDVGELQILPGVGRYTAGAVASFAFDAPVPIVDANIARVLARLNDLRQPLDSTRGQQTVWQLATNLVPKREAGPFNSALMELGALICLPRSPRCPECPVRSFCRAKNPKTIPVRSKRPTILRVSENCVFILKSNAVLLERETGPRWARLWRLPRVENIRDGAAPLLTAHYSITRHRVALKIHRQHPPEQPRKNQRWFVTASLRTIAMPAPHRRALNQLLFAEKSAR